MKRKRRTGPRERVNVSSRWAVIAHDWSWLDRPASVYWKKTDNLAQTNVFETIRSTLVISNQMEPSLHNKWVEAYEAAMVREGTPDQLRHAALAWILMQDIYQLDHELPLILIELLLNILQWHELPQVKSPSDEEKDQAVNVWRNLDREFHFLS